MKLDQLIPIYNIIEEVLKKSEKFKLNMEFMENQDLIEPHIDRLKRILGDNPEYNQYEKERLSLCYEYCQKDQDNNPIMINNLFQGLNNNSEFKEKMIELNNKNSEVLKVMAPKIEQYNELMNTKEIDITFIPITEEVPDGIMTGEMQKILKPLFVKNNAEGPIDENK